MRYPKGFTVVFVALTLLFAGANAYATTCVYCSEGSPEGFTPALYTAGTTFDASSRAMFDRLVLFERGTTKIIPGLAKSWDVSEDGKTYTFHLRKGVKFHTKKNFTPSRDFNAEDVLWSFYRQLDPNHPYHKISGGSYEYFTGMSMDKLIERIEKKDDYTVVFHLTRPEAPFIANMGMDFASIHSAEYADKMMADGTPDLNDQDPVGTGPFVLVSIRKTPPSATSPIRIIGAARPPSINWSFPSPRMHRCATPNSRPANVTSCPIPTRPTWPRWPKIRISTCWKKKVSTSVTWDSTRKRNPLTM